MQKKNMNHEISIMAPLICALSLSDKEAGLTKQQQEENQNRPFP